MGFDANAAFEAADEAVTALARAKHDQVDAEAEESLVQAREYAEHLVGGGDPTEHPYPARERSLTSPSIATGYEGLRVVYEELNRTRGSANPVLPFKARELWRFCEMFAESVGTPIPFEKAKRTSSFRSSDAILRILLRFEEAGALVVRRTRVDGKVAFLVRERRPADPPLGAYRQGSIPEEAS